MPEIIYYWLFGTLYKPPEESLMFLSFSLNIITKRELIRLNVHLTEYFNNLETMHDSYFQEVFRYLLKVALRIWKSTTKMQGNIFSFSGRQGRENIKE